MMGRLRLSAQRVRAALGGRAAAAGLRITAQKRGVVLVYHRVVDLASDPLSSAVSPEHFAEHLEVIARLGRPMQACKLAGALREGKIPHRAIVVTLDDGYADSFLHAAPLLRRYGVPATVFATTDHIGTGRELWWGVLERILLEPSTLPRTLALRSTGREIAWDLGADAVYSEADWSRYRGWTLASGPDPTERHRLFRRLHEECYALAPAPREAVLRELAEWAGIESGDRSAHRGLSCQELVSLASDGLVEVGAHSVTHPAFDRVPAEVQRREILESKQFLEELLDRQVVGFSYPHGRYDTSTLRIIREAGFEYACATGERAVWRGTDSLRLPRLYIPNENGDAFARRIRRWLGGAA